MCMFDHVCLSLPPPCSCVEALLAAGAAVDAAAAAGGHTPLLLACEAGGLDCVRVLLTAGADRSLATTVRLLCHASRSCRTKDFFKLCSYSVVDFL